MKRLLLTLAVLSPLVLAGCDENYPKPTPAPGEVGLIATAPDGTKLWAVYHDHHLIYFSSSGTQHSYGCGKGCTRTDNVPASSAGGA